MGQSTDGTSAFIARRLNYGGDRQQLVETKSDSGVSFVKHSVLNRPKCKKGETLLTIDEQVDRLEEL